MTKFTDAIQNIFDYMNQMENALTTQTEWMDELYNSIKPVKDQDGEDILILKGELLRKFYDLPKIWNDAFDARPNVDQTLSALGIERDDDEQKRSIQ